MTGPCVTSLDAYDVARKLANEYDRRKQKEKEMNKRKEATQNKTKTSSEGPSRTVTEIDYNKHEETVKELKRQEAEEEYNRKKVEAAQWCTLDHEHGPHCRRMVPGCSHDHQKEWAIYEKSTEEKLKAAERFKQEGNEAYRKCNYGLASVHYRKALLQFDYTFADGPEEEKQVEDVKLPCLLNLAACKCQQEDWDEVLTHCRLALEINPRSVKAFYRTGLAHIARDKFDLAKDALTSAHEIEPKNPEVIAALKQLKKNMDTYKVRQREVYREMIDPANPQEDEAETIHAAEEVSSSAVPPAQPADPAQRREESIASKPGEAGRGAEAAAAAGAEAAAVSPAARDEADGASSDPSGLRKRNVGVDTPSATKGDDDDDDDTDELSLMNSKAMNLILLAALVLAILAAGLWASQS